MVFSLGSTFDFSPRCWSSRSLVVVDTIAILEFLTHNFDFHLPSINTKYCIVAGCISGVARKFERWGRRSIFPTSGRGHVGVAKHCVVISFYFIHKEMANLPLCPAYSY